MAINVVAELAKIREAYKRKEKGHRCPDGMEQVPGIPGACRKKTPETEAKRRKDKAKTKSPQEKERDRKERERKKTQTPS